jgi:hypothetical protein
MAKKHADDHAETGARKTRKSAADGADKAGLGSGPKPIEELVLDYPIGKYSGIPLISLWAKEIKGKEENRHLTPNDVLELAMREVLSGKVGWDDLKSSAAANGNAGHAAADGDEKSKK